jgi:citrate lyase alpha subunit
MIEDGTITAIESSGVRGKIGEAISAGKLKGLAIRRSHSRRLRQPARYRRQGRLRRSQLRHR